MIQPQELRKGNKIIANGLHGGRIMTVDRLADKGTLSEENRLVMFEEHHVGEFLKDCKGMPLSPSILEMCGFTEFGACYTLSFDNMRINILTKSMRVALSDSIWNKRQNLLHIKYLHQLMNLYYSLTGNELPINLEKVKV